jgi:hypothetical protein
MQDSLDRVLDDLARMVVMPTDNIIDLKAAVKVLDGIVDRLTVLVATVPKTMDNYEKAKLAGGICDRMHAQYVRDNNNLVAKYAARLFTEVV